MAAARLYNYLVDSAHRTPQAVAVVDPGGGRWITYADLNTASDRLRNYLVSTGVGKGDRVGLFMRKSIDTLIVIFGILKAGAVYVPIDSGAPAARGAYILHNCDVKLVVIDAGHEQILLNELAKLGTSPTVLVAPQGGGKGLIAALDEIEQDQKAATVENAEVGAHDLAYILYTSGSTGKPKGVMLSHENSSTFVDWCTETFSPQSSDRFSSHAPFHFDLSILDIYVSIKHGATLVLVSEDAGKDAVRLAKLIADERISVWYSAPSILSLVAQFGQLEKYDHSSLRLVLFAGEVFPVKHLRALCELWRGPRYFNLYGPTETNVCTFYEVHPPVPTDRNAPYPIGNTCSHLSSRVIDEGGLDVPSGDEGELCIAGPGVMQGYWSLHEQNAKSFHIDGDGASWYRTGDIVKAAHDGCFTYLGRRDRMVKRRGYRIELGEIESVLYRHPNVKEAAVVAFSDEEGVTIVAFLSSRAAKHPSLIEMKRFCAENLPLYMNPDKLQWHESLPKTSTDKVDYQRLKEMG